MVELLTSVTRNQTPNRIEAHFPPKAYVHLGKHVVLPLPWASRQILADSSKHKYLYRGAVHVSVQYCSHSRSRLIIAVKRDNCSVMYLGIADVFKMDPCRAGPRSRGLFVDKIKGNRILALLAARQSHVSQG